MKILDSLRKKKGKENYYETIPWFMQANALDQVEQRCSTSELQNLVTAFINDGFVVIKNSIDDELCDRATTAFNAFIEKHSTLSYPHKNENGFFQRLVNFHLVIDELYEVFSASQKALLVQDILFEEPSCLYTSLMFEQGSSQDIHRDTPYFWTNPGYQYLGFWTALENTDELNGPLEVVRYGHSIGEMDLEKIRKQVYPNKGKIDAYSSELWDLYQRSVQQSCESKGYKKEQVYVNKGDSIIWHPQLPHGGAKIIDHSRSRRSLVCHVTPENMPVFHQDKFFDRQQKLDQKSSWCFATKNDRKYAAQDMISFGHNENIHIKQVTQ